ncbi:MAG TPA: LysE family translocator [Thermoanaerobaculia bacterium]|nr:LysE family translocator [Thermoanaerobaculia bacterium]
MVSFIAAALLLLAMPGPAVLYIVTRSATQGRTAGIASVLGVASGGLVHVLASVAGLSLLVARSATAMQYLRYGGALYLFYLGVQKLREAHAPDRQECLSSTASSFWRIYRDGFVVNILNPKTALFFLAFLPQFIDPAAPAARQVLVLGMLFVTMAVITDSCWAFAASSITNRVKSRFALGRRTAAYSAAAVYMGLAATAVVTGQKRPL